jgi:hypothetical protein
MAYDPGMGRQKQNKPRRERPTPTGAGQRRMEEIAAMLDLPASISDEGTGLVVEVAAVGFPGDGYATGDRPGYVRLTDGSVKLLPEGLRAWARGVVEAELDRRASGGGTMFPRRIEFGVNDDGEYAVLL